VPAPAVRLEFTVSHCYMKPMKRSAVAKRVKKSREGMRKKGLRLVQFWVPDTRAPGFAEELARQCREIAKHADTEVDAWLDKLNAKTDADLETQETAALGK
jgi:hypothetical protein